MFLRVSRALIAAAVALAVAACPGETRLDLGAPERVAEGVQLYRFDKPGLLDLPGPMAVQLLRLDPAHVVVRSAVANERAVSLETVPDMARRTGAIAAVNAGFFAVRSGDPTGVLEIDDELVSESRLMRGAVGLVRRPGEPVRLVFDRVTASVTLGYSLEGEAVSIVVDGVNTTRVRGQLMLYTPRYGDDTDTAAGGVEWQLDGTPLRVTAVRPNAGHTAIPRAGAVLSFGGTILPTALERLGVGQEVVLERAFHSAFGTLPETWADAADVVGGAGLLVHKGRPLADWGEEQLREGFTTERHPRTMIGVTSDGTIWIVTVDGRNPQHSLGMTFADLQRLARALHFHHALNLDGGGSTTMVVRGVVVNKPSDASGPRRVSDGIIVVPRRP